MPPTSREAPMLLLYGILCLAAATWGLVDGIADEIRARRRR